MHVEPMPVRHENPLCFAWRSWRAFLGVFGVPLPAMPRRIPTRPPTRELSGRPSRAPRRRSRRTTRRPTRGSSGPGTTTRSRSQLPLPWKILGSDWLSGRLPSRNSRSAPQLANCGGWCCGPRVARRDAHAARGEEGDQHAVDLERDAPARPVDRGHEAHRRDRDEGDAREDAHRAGLEAQRVLQVGDGKGHQGHARPRRWRRRRDGGRESWRHFPTSGTFAGAET